MEGSDKMLEAYHSKIIEDSLYSDFLFFLAEISSGFFFTASSKSKRTEGEYVSSYCPDLTDHINATTNEDATREEIRIRIKIIDII